MDFVGIIAALVVGLVVGGAGVFVLLRGRDGELRLAVAEGKAKLDEAQKDLGTAREELASARASVSGLESRLEELKGEKEEVSDKLDVSSSDLADVREKYGKLESQLAEREAGFEKREQKLTEDEARLKEVFENLSNKALSESMEKFVKQSDELLKQYREAAKGDTTEKKAEIEKLLTPMREKLDLLEDHNRSLESKRSGAYEGLIEQIKSLSEEQTGLRKETNRLVTALQSPGTAGAWGEMVLEKVVEMAGLQEHFNFGTQVSKTTDEGRQRPDMEVYLPGGRAIIVDSKAPMKQYLEGVESEEQTSREVLFREHAKKMADHAKVLGARKYSDTAETPDFTIMFVPSESAFRVAMESRPGLLEEAMSSNVVIATPSTMLALLRAVAFGWRQEKLAAEAMAVQKMGQELYDRICTVMGHYNRAAKSMNSAASALNEMGRSLESRVLVSARRFKEAGIESSKELPDRAAIDTTVQGLAVPEIESESMRPTLPGTDDSDDS